MHQHAQIFPFYVICEAYGLSPDVLTKNEAQKFPVPFRQFVQNTADFPSALLGDQFHFRTAASVDNVMISELDGPAARFAPVHLDEQVVADRIYETAEALRTAQRRAFLDRSKNPQQYL